MTIRAGRVPMIWMPRTDPIEENITNNGRMIMTPGTDCSPTREVRKGPRPRNRKRVRQYAAPNPKTVAIRPADTEAMKLFVRPLARGTVDQTSM